MLIAIAFTLPFLTFVTRPPLTNFWPLMVTWLCAGAVFGMGVLRGRKSPHKERIDLPAQYAAGLLLASLLASAIGLLQYFGVGSMPFRVECANLNGPPPG